MALVLAAAAAGVLGSLALGVRAAEAPVGRTFARIGAADAVALALDGLAAGEAADLQSRLQRLHALSTERPAQAARSREIAALVSRATASGGEAASMAEARRLLLRYRQAERADVAAYRAGLADRQRNALLWAMGAVVLGFLAGGFATFAIAGRQRVAEDALAEAAKALSRSSTLMDGIGAATPDMIYAKDLECRFIYANPALVAFLGHPLEAIIGHRSADLAGHPAGTERPAAADRRVLENGETVIGEGLTVGADGRERVMRTTKFPLRDASGAIVGLAGLTVDLTEAALARQALEESQAELARVSRLSAMGEMASALAHELNQPLSATANYVQGSLRLLDQTPIDMPLIKEALGIAGEQMFRAGDIIRRLRDFVAKGETERRIEPLSDLLEEAGALAMVGARDRGVRLRYAVTAPDLRVLADKVQIQQVLLNLIRNAIEAMADSDTRDLVVAAEPAPDGMVQVSVSDTGSGIGPEVAAQLFQPFVTTKADGMGVGLSISRTIIEAHGGRIWAEPNTPHGTVFNFTLCAVQPHELAEEADA